MGVGVQSHASDALPPGNRPDTQCYSGLFGPEGWSGRVPKISPLLGFDPRTVEPVASRYADWTTSNVTQLIVLK